MRGRKMTHNGPNPEARDPGRSNLLCRVTSMSAKALATSFFSSLLAAFMNKFL
jgi:hypothetical protein